MKRTGFKKRSGYLKRHKGINPKCRKPRRKRPELFGSVHGIRLYGAERSARRAEIFERSGGRCEEKRVLPSNWPPYDHRCNQPITWESMEWSHKRHGCNKCDCMECGIASCADCHRKRHAGGNGKPCPAAEWRINQ